jgi:inner membrane protein
MMAPTHIVTGLATVVVVGRVTGVTPDGVGLFAFIVGSLAPDIDGTGVITRPGTILRQLIGKGPANLIDAVFEFISAVLNFFYGHRGFIHSPLLAFSIFALGGYLEQPWLEWFGIGYASHLLGDAMTAGGIPLWSPFSDERVSLASMRTGSRQEYAVAVGMLLFTCVFGWGLLPEDVKQTHRTIYEKLGSNMTIMSGR